MTEDAMRRVCRALGGDDVEGAAERSHVSFHREFIFLHLRV